LRDSPETTESEIMVVGRRRRMTDNGGDEERMVDHRVGDMR